MTNGEISAFFQETREAEFLFETEVTDYLGEVYSKAVERHSIAFRLAGNELPFRWVISRFRVSRMKSSIVVRPSGL